ncbi:MAG: xylulose kinase [Planctomycetota bacterium]|nr:MAG: xylulose kinase [Planctomycetota bacterium]
MHNKLALGLDLSTQSISAVVIDIGEKKIVYEKSLNYLSDPRLSGFGINSDYILEPSEPGEALQPASMFLGAIDAILSDIKREFPDHDLKPEDIAVINFSAQQHGHVLLNYKANVHFNKLKKPGASLTGGLADILEGSLSVPFARIWRTANTKAQADFVRNRVGGGENIIRLSGSDAPLRFSGFGIRKTAEDFPEAYSDTGIIHQLNTFAAAVFLGNVAVPLDYGNACGTSLMDYREKEWSDELLEAAADGLPGGSEVLRAKLPALASGKTAAGPVAKYFVEKYGFGPECRTGIGSGDNPQSKVLVEGSLLSLGTSFVIMAQTDGETFDFPGNANAMYDAFERPFMFGCRTNGALRWDNVRAGHGFGKDDYSAGEDALKNTPPGNNDRIFLWQEEEESFPKSAPFEPVRIGYDGPDFTADYAGIIESTLASVYLYSRGFTSEGEKLFVTGGPAGSGEILRRIAAIWNREVVPIGNTGAALGAAVSGAYSLLAWGDNEPDMQDFAAGFVERGKPVAPGPADVEAYHGEDGYLAGFLAAYEKLISE